MDWVLERQHENADFADKIIFSDEAHFHLDGFVNRQNCRIWGAENPRMIHEKQMHPQCVTVWCGFWAGGIIGPFFIKMITSFFFTRIEEMNVEGMWFQQDGATCHIGCFLLGYRTLSWHHFFNWRPFCQLSSD